MVQKLEDRNTEIYAPDTRSFEEIAKDNFKQLDTAERAALYVNSSGKMHVLTQDPSVMTTGDVLSFPVRGVDMALVSTEEWDAVMSGDLEVPDFWGVKTPVRILERGEEHASED